MAHRIGTATGLEDLFGEIVDFLTSDTQLVADGMAWEALRLQRDNLLSVTTNINQPAAGASSRAIRHTFRSDSRSLNTHNLVGTDGYFYATDFSAGVSEFTMRLRQARTVDRVKLRAISGTSGTHQSGMIRDFRLQHSTDGNTWTTALTVTGQTNWSWDIPRTFAVPGSPGPYEWWRVVIDGVQSGSNVSWGEFMLLSPDDTVANHYGSEVILKAFGNGGTDEIFTGIRSEYDEGIGWYNLILNGYSGFDPNVSSWFMQPGALPSSTQGGSITCRNPMIPLWNVSMPFWLVASGRSFRMGVKVATNFEGGYLGLLLPYATPGQFPYPLAVGGSLVANDTPNDTWRYSYVHQYHGVYPGPGGNNPSGGYVDHQYATLWVRDLSGVWRWVLNRGDSSERIIGMDISITGSTAGNSRGCWPHCQNGNWSIGQLPFRDCLGGGYMIQPCIVLQKLPSLMIYGELEGTFVISGFNAAAEDTAVFNGKTHVVFQNAYRNSAHEHWALSMD